MVDKAGNRFVFPAIKQPPVTVKGPASLADKVEAEFLFVSTVLLHRRPDPSIHHIGIDSAWSKTTDQDKDG